jgi:RimJ/RimL family protein N-acetyltransferase
VIETEDFRLREWQPTDVPAPDEGPDEDSVRFMPASAHPNATTFAAWLQRRQLGQDDDENLNWCIADRARDHALGNLTIFRLGPARDRFQGELGYWLHPTARGRGILTETIPPLIDHAFAPVTEGGLGLRRLYASTDRDNLASQRVLLAAGFRRWGQDRQAYRNGLGELTDGAYFELLSTDDRVDRRPRRIEVPVLDGDAVRLRPWREGDGDRIVEACTDPRTRHWLSDLPQNYTEDVLKAFFAHCREQAALGTGLFLALADRSSDECVGSVALMSLNGPDPTTGEVGYWSHPAARGGGRMTEAVGLLIPHAFGPLGLRRLTLHAAAGNPASHHVAEINGFRRTGVQRQAERLGDGSFDDLVDFDLLAGDVRPSGRRSPSRGA